MLLFENYSHFYREKRFALRAVFMRRGKGREADVKTIKRSMMKIAAISMAVILVALVPALAGGAGHDCCGCGCEICARIASILWLFFSAATVLLLFFLPVLRDGSSSGTSVPSLRARSLVTLRVKLSD